MENSVYYIAGFLVVTNLGVLGSLIVVVFKAGQLITSVKYEIKDAHDTAVRAHHRIDKISGED